MWEEILKAIPVYFSSMLKFIFGPLGGYAVGLELVTTILATVAGMMTVVLAFTYAGNWLREKVFYSYFSKRKKFSGSNRRFVRIWKKYGLVGVAALTPVLLTPIGGSILAVSSGSPKEKIILFMFISASVWAVIFSVATYIFGNEINKMLPGFVK
jgi:membrane protein DedA with SNARE-associated domain